MVGTRKNPEIGARQQRCLVTGGAGFLGRHIVDALVDDYSVRVLDIRDSGDSRIETVIADIRKLEDVKAACTGMDVVIHTATAAPSAEDSLNRSLAYDVNVKGTSNVIQACQQLGISRLVFTSSASVVFEGKDLNDVDESAPYAAKPLDYYTQTKIEAEKIVLAANGVEGLATVALRPSGIFGEWDRVFVPQLVDKAKQGKMKYIIGNGKNLMEWTYAKNVADAHVLAAKKLSLKSKIAGKAYFVTNDEPVPIWKFFGDVLEPLGYGRPRIWMPFLLVYFLALVLERIIIPLFSPIVKIKPSEFTTSRLKIVTSNRKINISRIKRDLGYSPKIALKEGVDRTLAHFQPLAKGQEFKKVS